jgi:hypothetical protein
MANYRVDAERNGYEYRAVGYCPRTGRPFLSPIAWNPPSWSDSPHKPPIYSSCLCHLKRHTAKEQG